jgi:hypothetical protein
VSSGSSPWWTARTRPATCRSTLRRVGADAYTGNCHKWLCAPKGAGFLWVRDELQARIDPLVVTWGWDEPEFAEAAPPLRDARPGRVAGGAGCDRVPARWGWDDVRVTLPCPGRAVREASGLPIVPDVFGQMASFELLPAATRRRRNAGCGTSTGSRCRASTGTAVAAPALGAGLQPRRTFERLVAALASSWVTHRVMVTARRG